MKSIEEKNKDDNQHIHVVLPCGAMATISPDCSEEILKVLNTMAKSAIKKFDFNKTVADPARTKLQAGALTECPNCGSKSHLGCLSIHNPTMKDKFEEAIKEMVETGTVSRWLNAETIKLIAKAYNTLHQQALKEAEKKALIEGVKMGIEAASSVIKKITKEL